MKTARTGKLKRSKVRKEPRPDATAPKEATVGELLAALDQSAASPQPGGAPDDLGLVGYEDDPSQDLPPPPKEDTPAPGEPLPEGVELSDTLPMNPEDDISRVRGQASPRLMSVVESLLFASDRPLTVRDIRRVLKEPTVRQVQLALRQLQIVTAKRGVVLSQVAGGFRLRTNPSNAQWVQKLLAGKPARLSRSQLEALAVIAYRQPITKAEIDHVRGVDCGAVLRVLLERDLARIVGRKEEPGRPHLYGTTVEFLEFFNLRSLRDMPDLHEFQELTEESRAELRSELGEDADEVEAEVLGQEVLRFEGDEAGEGASEATGEAADGTDADQAAHGDTEATDSSEAPKAEAKDASGEACEVETTSTSDEPAAEADSSGEAPEAEAADSGDEPVAEAADGASEDPKSEAEGTDASDGPEPETEAADASDESTAEAADADGASDEPASETEASAVDETETEADVAAAVDGVDEGDDQAAEAEGSAASEDAESDAASEDAEADAASEAAESDAASDNAEAEGSEASEADVAGEDVEATEESSS